MHMPRLNLFAFCSYHVIVLKITAHSFFPNIQFSAYRLKKPLLHEIFPIVADLS